MNISIHSTEIEDCHDDKWLIRLTFTVDGCPDGWDAGKWTSLIRTTLMAMAFKTQNSGEAVSPATYEMIMDQVAEARDLLTKLIGDKDDSYLDRPI